MRVAKPLGMPGLNSLRQHALIALALVAINLAFFASIDYGNSYGNDDWMHLYRTCELRSPEIVDRPLALLSLFTLCPFLKADLSLYHLVLIGFRLTSAFCLYLLVWQISRQILFAFSCGVVFSVFVVNDGFLIFTYLQQNDHVFSQMLVLLALNTFVYCLRLPNGGLYKAAAWCVSFLLLSLTMLVREAATPLLFVIPLLIVALERPYNKSRLLYVGLWNAAIFVWVVRYIWVFRSNANYSNGTFLDVDPIRMYYASKNQFDFAFRPLLQLRVSDIYQFHLGGLAVIAIVVVGFLFVRHRLQLNETTQLTARHGFQYLGWILGGVSAAWLGLAAFLPTIYSSLPTRTHMLSLAGESVVLISVVWLVGCFISQPRARLLIQLGGLIWIGAQGTMVVNKTQQEMYGFSGTWDNSAYFFRSLANLVPAVKGPTLFVYIENPETDETPFVAGWNFQYGLRYFYNNRATGIVPSDSIFGSWKVTDAGIQVQEIWIDTPHTFGWNEIVFITREISGRVVILDQLPEPFLTAYRQSLYRPLDRIDLAFIPPRIQESFPILSGPYWTAENSLLR